MNAQFPGQWFQLETGLAYNWNRHYDPTLGRYIQPDPLGLQALLSDGPSAYGYAGQSPLVNVDPKGTCVEDACILESLAVVAGAYTVSQAVGRIAKEVAKFCPPNSNGNCTPDQKQRYQRNVESVRISQGLLWHRFCGCSQPENRAAFTLH